MKLLLDTHALIWLLDDDQRLSSTARSALIDRDACVWLSVASVWEIAIKIQLRKLDLGPNPFQRLELRLAANGIELLPISMAHCRAVSELDNHHRDPFDRLIAAQALLGELTLVSVDEVFDLYGVKRLS